MRTVPSSERATFKLGSTGQYDSRSGNREAENLCVLLLRARTWELLVSLVVQ
jgi:hypothetical protein